MTRKTATIQYIISLFLFGTIGMALRQIDLPSEIVVLGRGVFGSVFIALYFLFRKQKPDLDAIRMNRVWLLISGICLGLNWIFLFAAYRVTTVAIASLCDYMAPIIIIILSPVLFKERLTFRKLLCVAAALAGIVCVSGVIGGDPAAINGKGIILGLLGAVSFSGIIIFNRRLRDLSAYDRALVQLLISAVVVLPYVIFANFGKTLPLNAKSVLLTVMIGMFQTGLAYILYFGSISCMPVQSVAILGYIEPVVSVLCSALILREPLTAAGRVGALLILGAAVVSELQ